MRVYVFVCVFCIYHQEYWPCPPARATVPLELPLIGKEPDTFAAHQQGAAQEGTYQYSRLVVGSAADTALLLSLLGLSLWLFLLFVFFCRRLTRACFFYHFYDMMSTLFFVGVSISSLFLFSVSLSVTRSPLHLQWLQWYHPPLSASLTSSNIFRFFFAHYFCFHSSVSISIPLFLLPVRCLFWF